MENPADIKEKVTMNRKTTGIVDIPTLDSTLKKYLENRPEPLWIYDPFHLKNRWINTLGMEAWGVNSVEEFLDKNYDTVTENGRYAAIQTVENLRFQKQSVRPWVFYMDGKDKPTEFTLRMTAIFMDEDLCILAEAIKEEHMDSVECLVHDSYKFSSNRMSVLSAEGNIKYQNILAEATYNDFVDQGMLIEDGCFLKYMFGYGMDPTEYENMVKHISLGKIYQKRIKMPSRFKNNDIWHDVSICQRKNAVDGSLLIDVHQTDATEVEVATRALHARKLEENEGKVAESVGVALKDSVFGIAALVDDLVSNQQLEKVVGHSNDPELSVVLPSIRLIQESAEKISKSLESMIEISHLKRNKFVLDWQEIEVSHVIDAAMAEFGMHNMTRDIKLIVPKNLPFMYADRVKLHQVFKTIFSNAFMYSTTGAITVKVDNKIKHNAGCLVVSVSDEGVGIDEKTLDNLFDPFHSETSPFDDLKTTPQRFNLCIAKSIIELHGGSIFVASTINQGTTITFSIPYRPDKKTTDHLIEGE